MCGMMLKPLRVDTPRHLREAYGRDAPRRRQLGRLHVQRRAAMCAISSGAGQQHKRGAGNNEEQCCQVAWGCSMYAQWCSAGC